MLSALLWCVEYLGVREDGVWGLCCSNCSSNEAMAKLLSQTEVEADVEGA